MFTHGETVTILRDTPGGFDQYGDPIPSSTARIDIVGCGIDDRYSTEPTERGRQGVIVGKTILAPAGSDFRSTDGVEVRGKAYVVDGDAGEPVSPFTGWAPGVVVAIRRAVG